MKDYQDEQNALIPDAVEDDEAISMTLSGIGRGDAPLDTGYVPSADGGGGGGILSHTTLIIVVCVVVAAGALYLMRATQGEFADSKEVQEVEAKIAKTLIQLNNPSLLPESDPLKAENLKDLLEPTDNVVAIFEHDVREQQVPIEDVKKDPFSLTLADDTSGNTTTVVNHDSSKQLEKLNTELARYDLQSIMMGARNIAVIGGEFYKRGDKLGSFTITEIEKFTVHLDAAGTPFKLTLEGQGH